MQKAITILDEHIENLQYLIELWDDPDTDTESDYE